MRTVKLYIMIATEKNWGGGGSSCLKIEEYTSSSKAKVKMGLFCKFLSDQIQTGLIFTITYIPGHNTHAIFIFDSAGACVRETGNFQGHKVFTENTEVAF